MNIRKEKGMTQQQLAEKLYITDKAVSKWERGLSFPDITILKSLAEILELDVSELLNCKKGKKEDIDIQKIVDEKIQEIDGKVVSLGPRILRTETASVVASSIVLYELSDLGGNI